jgi:hypothetical protein
MGTFLYERVEGSVADFRSGAIAFDPGGITVEGKVVPRAEIYQSILITMLFIYGSWLIAWAIMRYGCLSSAVCGIPWNTIRSITTVPKKRKLCIVYQAPNYKGIVKTFSITMQFKKPTFDSIVETLEAYAPGMAQPGKIRSATSPVLIVWATCFITIMLIAIVSAILHSSGIIR